MDQDYTENATYDKADFTQKQLKKGEYENCIFNNCNFSNTDLAEIKFTGCRFSGCDLSLASLKKTSFHDAVFSGCKMLGLNFGDCNDFNLSFTFKNCLLDHCSFYRTKIRKTIFTDTKLQEADFTECDLTGSVFENCDFTRAAFDGTILEKADLRTSRNFSIDPEINRIRKAKFSLSEIGGLLDKYQIEIDRTM